MSAIKIHLIEIAGHYDMRSRVLERRAETRGERESGCTIAELLLSFHFQMKANYAAWREDRAACASQETGSRGG